MRIEGVDFTHPSGSQRRHRRYSNAAEMSSYIEQQHRKKRIEMMEMVELMEMIELMEMMKR